MLYHITHQQHTSKLNFFIFFFFYFSSTFFLKWANTKLVKTTTFWALYKTFEVCLAIYAQISIFFQFKLTLSGVADIWLMLLCCGCYVGENFVNAYGTDVKNWKQIFIACFGCILGNKMGKTFLRLGLGGSSFRTKTDGN